MPSDSPLVSVGMPSYNKAEYVAEAIESILAQSHTNLELIVSDDRSSDTSPEIIRQLAERDPRVRYVAQPHNLGMIGNFDYVLNAAKGDYFMWFSADDRVDPEWIATCLANVQRGGAIGFGRVADVLRDGSIKRRYPLCPVQGPRWWRMVYLYWAMLPECNMLHGVTRTERVRAKGGLAPYAFAGQAFDVLHVWESTLDAELLASDGPWLYKRDSINNNVLQSGSMASLVRSALWPAVPLRRIVNFHRTRLPLGIQALLLLMFLPRCVFALLQWYGKGFGVMRARLSSRSAAR